MAHQAAEAELEMPQMVALEDPMDMVVVEVLPTTQVNLFL
jgi:hypothetical protein